ncbi:10738_t:CDS:2 [Ambispora gerdemannii]|uniref:10738_t:CDS:1 n=1 Tax=Ambispora gerdemannii TaxID=144530 RepID=A0A9N9D060_9GLOM|nr:10738_t:CDS:2 [Ambispora gerdemannii]
MRINGNDKPIYLPPGRHGEARAILDQAHGRGYAKNNVGVFNQATPKGSNHREPLHTDVLFNEC